MSCCDPISVTKGADETLSWNFDSQTDLSGYTASFLVADAEGATPRLTVTPVPLANGSKTDVHPRSVTVLLKRGDLAALPNGSPASEPYTGICQLKITSPQGLVTVIETTPFVCSQGVGA